MAGKKFEFSTRPLGEVLVNDYMKPKKLGPEYLQSALQIDKDTCAALLDGRASISGDTAIQLSDIFGETPEFWMNIQSSRDLEEARWRKHQQNSRYYFLHIKKCAGTTLIGLAKNQKYVQFHKPDANGNPAHDDPSLAGENRYIRYWEFSEEKQRAFLLNQEYNFIANEVHLGDKFDHCPDLIYFTILRDPVKRALSQYYHMRHLNEKLDMDVDTFLKGKTDNAKVFNNYMAYQITGKIAKGYDEAVVTEAIARLEKFDHILFQETFSEDIKEFVDYGWDLDLMSSRNVRSKAQKDNPSKETLETLAGRLSSDQAIYDHFWKKRVAAKAKEIKASTHASSQTNIVQKSLFFQDKWEAKISELHEAQKAQKEKNTQHAKGNLELRKRIAKQHAKNKEMSKLSVNKQLKIKELHETNKELKAQISAMKKQK